MTFVIVGGGPTGVELAGAIAELSRNGLTNEYRTIDPVAARVILVQSADRLLPTFPASLSADAREELRRLNVEVLTGTKVEGIDADGVVVGGEWIEARTVLWAAGVASSPAARWCGAEADKAGRVIVGPDLCVSSYDHVFAIGDTAASMAWNGTAVPGLAPAAKQGGAYVAAVICATLARRPARSGSGIGIPAAWPPSAGAPRSRSSASCGCGVPRRGGSGVRSTFCSSPADAIRRRSFLTSAAAGSSRKPVKARGKGRDRFEIGMAWPERRSARSSLALPRELFANERNTDSLRLLGQSRPAANGHDKPKGGRTAVRPCRSFSVFGAAAESGHPDPFEEHTLCLWGSVRLCSPGKICYKGLTFTPGGFVALEDVFRSRFSAPTSARPIGPFR